MVWMLLMISELEGWRLETQWKVSLYWFPYCEHLVHSQISCKLSPCVLRSNLTTKHCVGYLYRFTAVLCFTYRRLIFILRIFHHFPKRILLHSELILSAYPWLIDFKFNDLRPKYLKKKLKLLGTFLLNFKMFSFSIQSKYQVSFQNKSSLNLFSVWCKW